MTLSNPGKAEQNEGKFIGNCGEIQEEEKDKDKVLMPRVQLLTFFPRITIPDVTPLLWTAPVCAYPSTFWSMFVFTCACVL